jgi:hypothetical protein
MTLQMLTRTRIMALSSLGVPANTLSPPPGGRKPYVGVSGRRKGKEKRHPKVAFPGFDGHGAI